ncbi:cold shock domain-containing protein E1 [Chrysoperla carnea]|uniref:cold shock domain-containing protein E1 n=1 Tax=Chrysoperla carnea TaxID=189513 RepID=UPI001D08EA2A|nr:cold shock domain-containing protein E1 [Chrysoperla carnea]
MSSNPQWKPFQPPCTMNQDPAILDFKSMTVPSKPPQSCSYRNTTSCFGGDYPSSPREKSAPYSSPYSPITTVTTRHSGRFPIGTFSVDTNNTFNSSGDGLGSPASNNVYTNGNNGSTNSTYDSNSSNQGTRETGIIEKLLHSYGFIQCCERQARLFFHFSQFSGNIEHLKIGDPVEFEMTYDRRTGKPIASTVTKIAPEVVLSEERVTGTVTTELRAEGSGGDTQGRISYENRGECFFLPYTKDDVEGNVTLRSGDKVSFQIATNQRGNLGACHVRLENPAHPVKYQGVVCSMKESFGFIERADVVKEIFFHFSEAKTKEELRLGDDVEFIIQTRNGKEVACNITKLPPGTVVFEDIKPDIIKGQVLKPLDRGNVGRHQNDPLTGRIRYRAADHSEVEVPFGDKDQSGDFTLRHGDWVQFRIATDRRDQLDRASGITLLDESFVVSGERREQGVVAAAKDGFGFLKCVEREARLFFHFNEVLDIENDVNIGDEFEFTVIQDQTTSFCNSRQSAIRMKRLPQGTVKFETLTESNVTGVVTKEIPNLNWINRSPLKSNGQSPNNGDKATSPDNGLITYQLNGLKKAILFYPKDCDLKNPPRIGDKVEFDICQVKRNKELIAVDIKVVNSATNLPNGTTQSTLNNTSNTSINNNSNNNKNGRSNSLTTHQGFIAALKDGFGFIETVQHDREVFFHFSNFEGDANTLELGQEVEYTLATRGSTGSCSSAENVKILPKGTIEMPIIDGEVLDGTVVRPLRSVNPDQSQYAGLIQVVGDGPDDKGPEYEFGIMGLANKKELLQVGDPVQLQVDSAGRAANIIAVRKKRRTIVDAIKGPFGFLAYEVEEGKKLFFHMSEVKEGVNLQPGDQVEFVLVTNQRNGKSSACNVTKISGDVQARPERLNRLRTVSLDDAGPKLQVLRQPKGPDGSRGFSSEMRSPRLPGIVAE